MKNKFREDMTSDSGAETITNSNVECYFGIIKARMTRKIRYSAAQFLNKQYIMIKGLCNEVEIKVPKKEKAGNTGHCEMEAYQKQTLKRTPSKMLGVQRMAEPTCIMDIK